MTSSWSTLSEKNLNHIFSFCTYYDLKTMSLVCKNWHAQFDIYVRDKVWLCPDKIVLNAKPHDFFMTKRTFEKLKITNYIMPTEPYIKDTLSPVSHIRDTHMKIKYLHIDLEDYRIVPEIFDSVGFTFTHLSLAVKDEKAVESSILRECKVFKKLECVRHLKIFGFTPEFEKFFKYFKNLKSLDWESSLEINPYRQAMYSQMPETMEGASNNFTALRKNLVRTLVGASPNIEELSLLNIVKNFIDFDIFKELRCLKKFKTNVPGLWKNILDNKSPLESLEVGGSHIRDKNLLQITTNFKSLKKLGVGFKNYAPSTNVLKEMWTMPKLKYIHFDCLKDIGTAFISFAPNITTLKLNEIELTVDFIATCSKATPNVEFAEMNSIQDGVSFRFFQEMASNWQKLETLNIRLQTKIKFTERDLKFPLINTPVFMNLRNLLMQTDFFTVPFQFFKSFRAPNLKRAFFDLDSGRPKEEKSNKIVPFILANSPLIENMKFKSCLNLNHDTVRTICKTLKNIQSLTFVECGSLRVGIVRDILRIAKNIQFLNLYYFEEIGEIIDFRVKEHMTKKFLKFGQTVKKVDAKNNPEKKYEMAVENLCKARIPHLKLYVSDGLTRFLKGNNIEVILAKGVDLYKYDSALDSYSENLKRTFDDIYENVFKPQFRKCGEEEEGGSDDGSKSPRASSKKKTFICPSKIPRANKKEDKENQPLATKQFKKEVCFKSKVLVEQNVAKVNDCRGKVSPHFQNISPKEVKSKQNITPPKSEMSQEDISPLRSVVQNNTDDAKNQNPGKISLLSITKTEHNIITEDKEPLAMKVLAEKRFLELPADMKLKQSGAPSVTQDEIKKKSSEVKLRSMVSFMSPKFKSNVLKSPVVRRFSLQRSAVKCTSILEEDPKMEVITSNAVKDSLKFSDDIENKRKSKLVEVEPSQEQNKKNEFIIPEIIITPPDDDEEAMEEEDAKHISQYYEFYDVETDDEFFDCEDFENTVMYYDLCSNKGF